jgi:hypothetical protein
MLLNNRFNRVLRRFDDHSQAQCFMHPIGTIMVSRVLSCLVLHGATQRVRMRGLK